MSGFDVAGLAAALAKQGGKLLCLGPDSPLWLNIDNDEWQLDGSPKTVAKVAQVPVIELLQEARELLNLVGTPTSSQNAVIRFQVDVAKFLTKLEGLEKCD